MLYQLSYAREVLLFAVFLITFQTTSLPQSATNNLKNTRERRTLKLESESIGKAQLRRRTRIKFREFKNRLRSAARRRIGLGAENFIRPAEREYLIVYHVGGVGVDP